MTPTFNLQPGTYFGGKSAAGVVHRIINQIPQHKVFVSGFLGRCAVMRWKMLAELNIGVDLDGSVIGEWRDAAGQYIELYRTDFIALIPLLKQLQNDDTFLYLDPPYLHETRSSNTRYKYELMEAEHRQLLTKVKTLPCMVAISCYDSELYQVELLEWRKIQFRAQTRGGIRMETLYMNYPEPMPASLHDVRFLGSNFRERETAKRRIETIKNKITRLDPNEKAQIHGWLKDLVDQSKTAIRPALSQ